MTHTFRWWLLILVAIAAIAYGVMALGKPYWSLESMPVLLVFAALFVVLWHGDVRHRARIAVLIAIVATGTMVAPNAGVALLVYGVVAWLLVRGIGDMRAFRQRPWFTAVAGLAQVLLAMVGIYWLDVTSIVIGLLVGPMLIVAGVMALLWARRPEARESARRREPRGGMLIAARIGSVILLLVAMAATIATGVSINRAPHLDDFAGYAGPLGDQPGVLLRSAPFTRGMPDNSAATRMLYTTTGLDGQIVLATGLVIIPADAPAGPMPVVLWAHGTTGIEPQCAPSSLDDPLGAGAFEFADRPLASGWAIVAPDYLGLGASAPHPYLVGKPTAHSWLDAVRAARQLKSVSLSDQTVVWGHSQGGGTALWIGIEAPTYAPDVPLVGVAALAPASALPGFISTMVESAAGPIFAGYLLAGYASAYENITIRAYVRPGARFSQEKIVQRCLSEPSILASVASMLIRERFTQGDLEAGAILARLEENIPAGEMGVPVFIGQGDADSIIDPVAQEGYVSNLCGTGQVVEYHTYTGLDHLSVVDPESPLIPELMSWTTARFAGEPAAQLCTTVQH